MALVRADYVSAMVALEEILGLELPEDEAKERGKAAVDLPSGKKGRCRLNRIAQKEIDALAQKLNGIRGLTKAQWRDLMTEAGRLRLGYVMSDAQNQRVQELTDLILDLRKLVK